MSELLPLPHAWADALAVHTDQPGILTRTYLTDAHHGAAAQLTEWMQAAGMTVVAFGGLKALSIL